MLGRDFVMFAASMNFLAGWLAGCLLLLLLLLVEALTVCSSTWQRSMTMTVMIQFRWDAACMYLFGSFTQSVETRVKFLLKQKH